jgi:RimJ/RimL family protein N-acetyltransferase
VDLVLRETTLDDLPILFEHQRDPVANEVPVFAARDWVAFVANDAKIRSDPTLIRRTVVVDDEVVGSIGCFGDEQRAVGYWYDRAVWGRGIATAALAAFLDDVTERPVFAHVAVKNVGSARSSSDAASSRSNARRPTSGRSSTGWPSRPPRTRRGPRINDPAGRDGPLGAA